MESLFMIIQVPCSSPAGAEDLTQGLSTGGPGPVHWRPRPVHWRPRPVLWRQVALPLSPSLQPPNWPYIVFFFFFWNKFSLCSWGWPRIPVSVLPQLLLAQFPNIGLLSSRLKVILGPDNWALTDTRKHLLVWDSSNQVFWLFWIAQELKFGPRPPISDRI